MLKNWQVEIGAYSTTDARSLALADGCPVLLRPNAGELRLTAIRPGANQILEKAPTTNLPARDQREDGILRERPA
jgi:hypothetical protein